MKSRRPLDRIKPTLKPFFTGLISWLKLLAPVAMLAWIPILSRYLLNSYQLSIQEIWFPLLINFATAIIVSLIFYPLWRRSRLAGFIGAILAIAIFTTNFNDRFLAVEPVLKAIIPPQFPDQILSLILIFLVIIASYWTGKGVAKLMRLKNWNARNLLVALIIAISTTFALQAIPTVRNLAAAWPQFFYTPPKLAAAPAAANSAAKPDIYYIILDRYASSDVLQNQFGYDNANFLQYLNDNQFYVNPNAHQNYPYTAQSVASTMNADYDKDMIQKFDKSKEQTTVPYDQTIRNSAVAQHLKTLGYKYDLVGNWYETSNLSPQADHTFVDQGVLTLFNHTYIIDNFAQNELLSGLYWQFIQPGLTINQTKLLTYQNAGGDQMTLNQLKALKTLISAPTGGRFIFTHILVPHDPYFFNADGSFNQDKDGNNAGEPIKQKYLNQVKFINGQMQTVISQIKQNSGGKAVIILQADEGPYPLDLNQENFDPDAVQDELANGSMLKWPAQDLKMKFGNLAAYYIPGATPENLAAGGNNVNAFRLVLNTLFGEQLPYLPECYYAYPSGRSQPFLYKNINQVLTGQTNPACADNGTGPKT